MPTLSLGSVAGGNYVAPKTNWTNIPLTNSAGHYMFGQDTRAMVADVKYFDGKFWVIFSDQYSPVGTNTAWYNADPVGNPGGWQGIVYNGGNSAHYGSPVAHYNSTQGIYYWGQAGVGDGYLRTSTTITGTKTYRNIFDDTGGSGGMYAPMGIDSNGGRTVLCGRAVNSNNNWGCMFYTDNGINYTQRGNYLLQRLNDVVYVGNSVFLVLGNGGTLYRSASNGSGFETIPVPDGSNPNYIKGASNRNGKVVIIGENYKLYTSTDYGVTWSNSFTHAIMYAYFRPTNNPGNQYINSFPVSIHWSESDNCFVYMAGNQQWYSDANGANWTQNTTFSSSVLGSNQVSMTAKGPDYWLGVAAKNVYDAQTSGLAKSLAWTDNIKGI